MYRFNVSASILENVMKITKNVFLIQIYKQKDLLGN